LRRVELVFVVLIELLALVELALDLLGE